MHVALNAGWLICRSHRAINHITVLIHAVHTVLLVPLDVVELQVPPLTTESTARPISRHHQNPTRTLGVIPTVSCNSPHFPL